MRIQDIIAAKRDGVELDGSDIARIIGEYVSGLVPDYQMSAFLMAVRIRGMTFAETTAMTQAMVESGIALNLSAISDTKVDKHSTGGVGDKTTLVVVPILAARGLKVPKMSGRGLGFTGGTLDKLESIPGFRTNLSIPEFISQVRSVGAAIAGQSGEIVPADKKIYALRDVTATVDSIPLIAASVMSKKIACSSDVILLDVKAGSGAFMRDTDQARELARTMIAIGSALGRKTAAAITDMSQPLGNAVGNALEVAEAIETLKGSGPQDVRYLCVELCAILFHIVGLAPAMDEGRDLALSAIDSGLALRKFSEIVDAQGGNRRVLDDPSLLPRASVVAEVTSRHTGSVETINCAQIGAAASIAGAGRERKEDAVDPSAGVVISKKLGDSVRSGDLIATIHTSKPEAVDTVTELILGAYRIGKAPRSHPLVYKVLQ